MSSIHEIDGEVNRRLCNSTGLSFSTGGDRHLYGDLEKQLQKPCETNLSIEAGLASAGHLENDKALAQFLSASMTSSLKVAGACVLPTPRGSQVNAVVRVSPLGYNDQRFQATRSPERKWRR